MMKKIILSPTDFSQAALNASEYAVHLANEFRAKLILIHIHDFPEESESYLGKTFQEESLEKERLLKQEVFRLNKIADVEVEYIVKRGLIVNSILEIKADLVVMGMRSPEKMYQENIVSVTTSVMKKTSVPIIVVPQEVQFKKPENIVYASDGDPRTDQHTLDFLKEFTKVFSSHVYILNVKHKKESIVLEETLEEMNREKIKNSEHVYYFTENEDFATGIIDFVKEKQADMVSVIPHHYDLIESFLHKSVSRKIVLNTEVPVLVLPDLRSDKIHKW